MNALQNFNAGLALLLAIDPGLEHQLKNDGADTYFIVFVHLGGDFGVEVTDELKSVLSFLGWGDTNEDNTDKSLYRLTYCF